MKVQSLREERLGQVDSIVAEIIRPKRLVLLKVQGQCTVEQPSLRLPPEKLDVGTAFLNEFGIWRDRRVDCSSQLEPCEGKGTEKNQRYSHVENWQILMISCCEVEVSSERSLASTLASFLCENRSSAEDALLCERSAFICMFLRQHSLHHAAETTRP